MLDPDAIRRWARRPWAEVASSRASWWKKQVDRDGAALSVRVADMLRRHVAEHASDSLERERADDYRHHVELKRKIDAASARFRR